MRGLSKRISTLVVVCPIRMFHTHISFEYLSSYAWAHPLWTHYTYTMSIKDKSIKYNVVHKIAQIKQEKTRV